MADSEQRLARRSLLSHVGLGVAAVSALGASGAQAQTGAGLQPTRHTTDDWLDEVKAAHRLVIDSTTPQGGGAALAYANNFLVANNTGYGVDAPALAVVVVLRHFSTPFAYNDAIWSKYGAVLAEPAKFTDPKTRKPPTSNLYNAPGYGLTLPNFGTTIDSLAKQGVQFAVCDMANHFFASQIADQKKSNADSVYREL